MIQTVNDVNYQINRILRVIVEWLGLQGTAVKVLTIWYGERYDANISLSIDDISRISRLSQTTVSSICSQLESFGILEKRQDDSQKTKGRRRIIFCLRLGLGDLLKLGLSKNINRLFDILSDIQQMKLKIDTMDKEDTEKVKQVLKEVSRFLTEPLWN